MRFYARRYLTQPAVDITMRSSFWGDKDGKNRNCPLCCRIVGADNFRVAFNGILVCLFCDSLRSAGSALSGDTRCHAQRQTRIGRGALSLNRLFFAVFLFFFVCSAHSAFAEQFNVYFKSSPRFELLRPFSDPANLSVLVTGADGRPVDAGNVRVRLDAPPSSRFFSTDYPIVEGTRLMDLSLPLVRGRAEWKYLLPIRGPYRLHVDVLMNGTSLTTRIFDFSVRENESKWFFLAGFLVLLFGVGWIAGRVFTAVSARAATGAILLAFLGAVGRNDAAETAAQNSPEGFLEVAPATVGKLSSIRWRLTDADSVPATALTLTITHLEKGKMVFAIEKLRVGREFSFEFQFADGAQHRVRAIVEQPGKAPTRAEQLVDVTGVEPPVSAMARSVALFVAAIAAGLWLGRWSKKRSVSAES